MTKQPPTPGEQWKAKEEKARKSTCHREDRNTYLSYKLRSHPNHILAGKQKSSKQQQTSKYQPNHSTNRECTKHRKQNSSGNTQR